MSSPNIPFTLSNVAQAAVAKINANNTLSSSDSSNAMTFGGVVISSKGQPGEVIAITANDWKDKLGTPYHSSKGVNSESLRHVGEATVGGDGYVVRAVPATATYPVIHVAPYAAPASAPAPTDAKATSVKALNLPDSVISSLIAGGIDTVEQLDKKSEKELLSINGIGKATLLNIHAELDTVDARTFAEEESVEELTTPSLTVTSVSTGADLSTVVIAGTSENIEADQVVTVSVSKDAIEATAQEATVAADGSWTTTEIDMTAYEEGVYTVSVYAQNIAGDNASSALSFGLTAGAIVLPTIELTSVSDDNIVDYDELATVSVIGSTSSVEEGQEVALSVFVRTDLTSELASSKAIVASDGSFSATVDMSGFVGDYTVTASTSTASGISTNASLDFTVNEKPPTLTFTNEGVRYGEEPELADDDLMMFYIIDGADSDNRLLSMTPADADMYGENMFEVKLTEVDSVGYETTLETHYVSLVFGTTDDMGSDVYIESVLESDSDYMRVECASDASAFTEFEGVAFTGASNGDINDITYEDLDKAVSILSASMIQFTGVCSLGLYDEAITKALITIANNRRIGSYHDVNPRLNYDEACDFLEGLSISEHRACFYHFPFTSKDPYHKNRNIWGISGVAFAAKAAGVMTTSSPGGWHLTPAGVDRAVISRTNAKPITGLGTPDYERMYKCRLNKLDIDDAGTMFIDDSLTSHKKQTHLRFEQQVSVADAISRDVYALYGRLKHGDDTQTEKKLNEGVQEILDGYVYSGALVTPRDPDDGDSPYAYIIEQKDVDRWDTQIAICVTGSFRRGPIEPILLR
ncbi:TPA: hypothetical protein L3N15_004214 [Vibrio parahaemolyticus]|nr:hypothetical protein [Vibrio parahaemolyticus]